MEIMDDERERQEARAAYQALREMDYSLINYLEMLFEKGYSFPAIVEYAVNLRPEGMNRLQIFAAVLYLSQQKNIAAVLKPFNLEGYLHERLQTR
jgi:hypothetical protein